MDYICQYCNGLFWLLCIYLLVNWISLDKTGNGWVIRIEWFPRIIGWKPGFLSGIPHFILVSSPISTKIGMNIWSQSHIFSLFHYGVALEMGFQFLLITVRHNRSINHIITYLHTEWFTKMRKSCWNLSLQIVRHGGFVSGRSDFFSLVEDMPKRCQFVFNWAVVCSMNMSKNSSEMWDLCLSVVSFVVHLLPFYFSFLVQYAGRFLWVKIFTVRC